MEEAMPEERTEFYDEEDRRDRSETGKLITLIAMTADSAVRRGKYSVCV